MNLTIQIVNFRSRHYLRECLFSIKENLPDGSETEVLVINNDPEVLSEMETNIGGGIPLQVIELNENVGFGRAHNIGFGKSKGEYILFLNPDTKMAPQAIRKMIDILEKKEGVGIVGPVLVDTANQPQPDSFGGKITPFSTIGRKFAARRNHYASEEENFFEADWVSGGAMLVRRSEFEKVGGFDEKFFMYFEDVDLCLRIKESGSRIVVNPTSRIFHESGKSFESEREKKKYYYTSQDYYLRKHFGLLSAGIVRLLRLPYYVKNIWLAKK